MDMQDWQVCQLGLPWALPKGWVIRTEGLRPSGLPLLLPLHLMRPHLTRAGGRVGGCVSVAAEAGDEALRLAQDGADVDGRQHQQLKDHHEERR